MSKKKSPVAAIDRNRQTGRTSRMIEAAVQSRAKIVVVIFLRQDQAEDERKKFAEKFGVACQRHPSLPVDFGKGQRAFFYAVADLSEPLAMRPEVFVDHFVWENSSSINQPAWEVLGRWIRRPQTIGVERV